MHACSEQVQGQASKPSEGGDLEGEGREGKELRAKAAKQVREEKEKEKEKEQQRLEKAEKRRRSSIDRNQASRCWSRPGPAETDRPASAALPFDADLDGGTNKTTL